MVSQSSEEIEAGESIVNQMKISPGRKTLNRISSTADVVRFIRWQNI